MGKHYYYLKLAIKDKNPIGFKCKNNVQRTEYYTNRIG